jgi:hypothetical protein
MMGTQELRPGQEVQKSGQYQNTTTKTEVTCVVGEKFPPTPGKGQTYKLVDPTKHKSSK